MFLTKTLVILIAGYLKEQTLYIDLSVRVLHILIEVEEEVSVELQGTSHNHEDAKVLALVVFIYLLG